VRSLVAALYLCRYARVASIEDMDTAPTDEPPAPGVDERDSSSNINTITNVLPFTDYDENSAGGIRTPSATTQPYSKTYLRNMLIPLVFSGESPVESAHAVALGGSAWKPILDEILSDDGIMQTGINTFGIIPSPHGTAERQEEIEKNMSPHSVRGLFCVWSSTQV
jgi:hypothetical protein